MSLFRNVLVSCLLVWICGHVSADEKLDEIVYRLNDESYPVRSKAIKELVKYDISIEKLTELLDTTKDPESRAGIKAAIDGKWSLKGWVKLKPEDIFKKATPCGREAEGTKIYLVRAKAGGGDVLGKYQRSWGNRANFPIGQSEILLEDFETWIGKGEWKPWKKGMKDMIQAGMTHDGKAIYAIRTKYENGIHPGMLIEGEDEAIISWGMNVHRVKKFEVLTKSTEE